MGLQGPLVIGPLLAPPPPPPRPFDPVHVNFHLLSMHMLADAQRLSRVCTGLQVTRMMQELSEYYHQLANGSNIFCIDTDVGSISCYHSKCSLAATCSPAAKLG